MAKRSSTTKKTASGKKKAAKTTAVKKTAAKKTGGKKKTTGGKKTGGKKTSGRTGSTARIAAGSSDYPPYVLTFEGSLIPASTRVRGVHTLRVAGPPALIVDIAHNETDPGIPNLTVRIDQE